MVLTDLEGRRTPAAIGWVAAGVVAAMSVAGAAEERAKEAAKPAPARHYFVMKGQGAKYDVDSETPTEVKLTSEQTDGRYTFQDEMWKTTFKVPPHFHKEHSETFYLVAGQLEWTVNGETRVMGPGDLLYVPPDVVHAVRVVGDEDAHVLFIYEPGGYEKNILRELSYTEEARKRPEIRRRLREESDFNLVESR